jgi:hypothetical protein
MALQDTQALLARAAKDLGIAWQTARESWRDRRAEQIERDVLEPLNKASKSAVEAAGQLGEAIEAARRDCSDSNDGGG